MTKDDNKRYTFQVGKPAGEGYLTRATAEERPLDDLIAETLERPLSRRTLLARGRDLGLTVAASSFLTACGSAVAAHHYTSSPEGAQVPPKYLVMLIIDAGRPDYMSYANLPHIKRLMERGTYYDRAWVGQLEAITPASHATIASGCFPSNDGGIIGFWWEDPATGTTFNSVPLDGSDPDSLSVIMANAGAPTMAEYLKRHDTRAKVYAASGQKFYAADAAGGPFADYISYYRPTVTGGWGPTCIDGYNLPSHLLAPPRLSEPSLANMPLGQQDKLVGDLAIDVVRKERPRIVILNLPEMDWPVAHLDGGPLSPSAVSTLMRNADRVLGKLIHEYKAAGIFEDTVFMLLGDHGVTPLERFVDSQAIKSAMETIDTVVSFDSHTGSFGWLADPSLSATAARAVENAGIANLAAVYYLSEINGRQVYRPAPNTASAIHGTLGKAYRYLLHTMAGSTAPHVVCLFPERTGTLGSGGANPWKGDHGGASWASQSIPLIVAGPGIRRGRVSHFPARLADLAPTAMRLLGVPYPRTDGMVLADAMVGPLPQDVARQQRAGQYLAPYAGVLRTQSARETAGMPPMAHTQSTKPSGTVPVGPAY